MLKKIAVDQLGLGMHLHRFEGNWIDHPFWKSKFVLTSEDDLRRAKSSAVTACWIDVSKGRDVNATDVRPSPQPGLAAQASTALAERPSSLPAQPSAPKGDQAPSSMAAELKRAGSVCRNGREAVKSIFAEARLGRAVDAERCLPLVNEISDSVLRNPGAMISLARLKTADDYTYMHSVAVCALMVALGRTLGFDDDRCRDAGLAGLLHDTGKALMPPAVLNKPGKLTDDEYAVIKTHPQLGHDLLLSGGHVAQGARDVCLHHHEKFDGSGYPHNLAGEHISLLARMGAVCDVYDAVTSVRAYKTGWDPAESIARMASWQGHFDPAVFKAFVRSLGIYPTGSLVRLESGRLAIVCDQNPQALVTPQVKAFFSTKSQLRIPPEAIDLSRAGCNDRIVARENPAKWGFTHLDDLWAGEDALRAMG